MNEAEACKLMACLRSIEEQLQVCRNHIWDALHGHYMNPKPQECHGDAFNDHLDSLFRKAEALDMEAIPAEVQLEFDFDDDFEEGDMSGMPRPCIYSPIDAATASQWGVEIPKVEHSGAQDT
jgi:hypothetical protein